MKFIIFLICLYIYIFSFDIYSYLNVKNNIPLESSNYIDIYSMNRDNDLNTNIRLAVVYPNYDVYLNVDSRIYKLKNIQSTGANACEPSDSSFVRLESNSTQPSGKMTVLCLAINITDMIGLMSRYRERLYRTHRSDSETISYLITSGYFASAKQ